MTQDDEKKAVNAVMEGIMAAHFALSPTIEIPFENFHTYAHAALASLRGDGFEVVRNA